MNAKERAEKIVTILGLNPNGYSTRDYIWDIAAELEAYAEEQFVERGRQFQESVSKFPSELKEAKAEGRREGLLDARNSIKRKLEELGEADYAFGLVCAINQVDKQIRALKVTKGDGEL